MSEPGDLVIDLCVCGYPLPPGSTFVCADCEAQLVDDSFLNDTSHGAGADDALEESIEHVDGDHASPDGPVAIEMPLCRACLRGHPVAHEALLDEIDQMLDATGRFHRPAWLGSRSDTAPMVPIPAPTRSKGVAAPVSCPPQAAVATSLHLHEVI